MRTVATLLLSLTMLSASAQTWEAAGTGIAGDQALSARAVLATDDGTLVYGGGSGTDDAPAADAGVYRSTDGGQSWTQTLSGQSPRAFAGLDGSLYVATATDGVYRSDDDGATWTAANNGLTRSDFFALAASQDEGTLLAGTVTGTFRSFNGGTTWTSVNDVDTNALAFGDGETAWAGNFNADFNAPGVYKTTDLGDTWAPSGLDNERVNAILVASDGVVYAGISPVEGQAGVFRSADDGATWQATTAPDFSVAAFVELPDGTLWAASSFGALTSSDGETWTVDNTGTPDDDIAPRDIAFNPADGRLYIAERFQAPAVYRSAQPLVTSAEGPGAPAALALGVSPNPTAGSAEVTFALDAPAPVRVAVYDVLGRHVATLAEGARGAGDHTATWTPTEARGGVYLVRLESDGRVATRAVTLVR